MHTYAACQGAVEPSPLCLALVFPACGLTGCQNCVKSLSGDETSLAGSRLQPFSPQHETPGGDFEFFEVLQFKWLFKTMSLLSQGGYAPGLLLWPWTGSVLCRYQIEGQGR